MKEHGYKQNFFKHFFSGVSKPLFSVICVAISGTVHLLIKNQTFPAKARWNRDGSILSCSEIKLFEKLWEKPLNISIPMLCAGTELN